MSSWSVGEWEQRSATPSSLPVAGPSSSVSGQGSVQRHTRALQRSQRTHINTEPKKEVRISACVRVCVCIVVCDPLSAIKSVCEMQTSYNNQPFSWFLEAQTLFSGQKQRRLNCAETGCYSRCAAILKNVSWYLPLGTPQ